MAVETGGAMDPGGSSQSEAVATVPPLLVSLIRVAIVLVGGWMLQQYAPRLDWLYYLVAGSTVFGAFALGAVFVLRPPNRVF